LPRRAASRFARCGTTPTRTSSTRRTRATLPADDAKRQTAEVQKMTDKFTSTIDEMLKKKTAEVMEI
jgi:ribosome recycling factor